TSSHHYDIIISGAGCSGLSLLVHLLQSPRFRNQQILLVDQAVKNTNDRTWCFWENAPGTFQSIVYKEWKELTFFSKSLEKRLELGSFVYKLIRGIDFYDHCFSIIEKNKNVRFINAPVQELVSKGEETFAVINGEQYKAKYIFNSILFEKPQLQKGHYWLWQHFKGWIVNTKPASFHPGAATLMDFRTSQQNGTTFFYVLPLSDRHALVEYTLFSKELLDDADYERALKDYVETHLQIKDYTVIEKEFGKIPMTNFPFASHAHNIINIGTAGGQTKASSGYTFQFIQKQSKAIVKGLIEKNNPLAFMQNTGRFQFYDSVLLQILSLNKMQGDEIFTDLFRRNKAHRVLKFLDNETSVMEEIPILKSLPTGIFLKAGVKEFLS
ncbi:MAG TPA: lycopene cyclase family protein, partial [Chitinophagaceae bacterium]|nr:lycopene cyclase family protein [Chitinophagaceae bacterium]